MTVCKNCLSHMGSIYRNDKMFKYRIGFSPTNFTISDYLQKYTTTHKVLPTQTEKTYQENDYTNSWSTLSRRFREEKKWKCEGCGNDFNNQKAQLHVHHKNGI